MNKAAHEQRHLRSRESTLQGAGNRRRNSKGDCVRLGPAAQENVVKRTQVPQGVDRSMGSGGRRKNQAQTLVPSRFDFPSALFLASSLLHYSMPI